LPSECRDERGIAFFDNTIRDVRFALRSFRRAPLAAVTIVATVAIGLGLVTALYAILNAFLFRVDNVSGISELYAVEVRLANGDPSPLTRPAFEARASTHLARFDRHSSVFGNRSGPSPVMD
jgi:hypothetical protein